MITQEVSRRRVVWAWFFIHFLGLVTLLSSSSKYDGGVLVVEGRSRYVLNVDRWTWRPLVDGDPSRCFLVKFDVEFPHGPRQEAFLEFAEVYHKHLLPELYRKDRSTVTTQEPKLEESSSPPPPPPPPPPLIIEMRLKEHEGKDSPNYPFITDVLQLNALSSGRIPKEERAERNSNGMLKLDDGSSTSSKEEDKSSLEELLPLYRMYSAVDEAAVNGGRKFKDFDIKERGPPTTLALMRWFMESSRILGCAIQQQVGFTRAEQQLIADTSISVASDHLIKIRDEKHSRRSNQQHSSKEKDKSTAEEKDPGMDREAILQFMTKEYEAYLNPTVSASDFILAEFGCRDDEFKVGGLTVVEMQQEDNLGSSSLVLPGVGLVSQMYKCLESALKEKLQEDFVLKSHGSHFRAWMETSPRFLQEDKKGRQLREELHMLDWTVHKFWLGMQRY